MISTLLAKKNKKVNRRDFLKVSSLGTTGLLLSMYIPVLGCGDDNPSAAFTPNVYLEINEKGDVTIIAHRSDMGQGVRTSLPMIIAEEMEADWSRVSIRQAIGDEKYGDQNTDGSYSIRMFYEPMRKAGATARMLLEKAASQRWNVSLSECKAQNHEVVHEPSGKKLSFGELALPASKLSIPDNYVTEPKLKNPKDFKYIGSETQMLDLQDIVTGKAVYGIDASTENAKAAVVLRCPVVGGKVQSFNATETKEINGVLEVFKMDGAGIPPQLNKPLGGIVVVANNTWAAMKGRDALTVNWDFGPNANYDSEQHQDALVKELRKKGTARREHGMVKQTFDDSGNNVIEAIYRAPYYAHGTIEPPCATAKIENGKCHIWAPTQHPQFARDAVADALGMEKKDVIVNVTLLGGGFGRKSKPDYVVEAAVIAKQTGYPIRLLWTREDDVHHDFYHALSAQNIKVAINKKNEVVGWYHKTAFPSIGATSDASVIEPSDAEMGLGASDLPYDIPALCLESLPAQSSTRIGWVRSVSNIHHVFAIGSMVDAIAFARNMDPAENLLDLLGTDRSLQFEDVKAETVFNYGEKLEDYPFETARLRRVIEQVKEKSAWGKSLPERRAQGIFAHRSFLTYVACVVEVAINSSGNISIPEVHYAVDCGVVVNKDRVVSQFEGGAIFATSLALNSEITYRNGRVQQNNFDGYQIARMSQSPQNIYVHILESDEKPTGVGEPPVPPFIPALSNAIFKATGKRVTQLPVNLNS